jgi:hypothetical protein
MSEKPKDFTAYRVGLCLASVCSSLTVEETTERLNISNPTGIDSKWSLSGDETFRNGMSNPCACHDYPDTHKHYLFCC